MDKVVGNWKEIGGVMGEMGRRLDGKLCGGMDGGVGGRLDKRWRDG